TKAALPSRVIVRWVWPGSGSGRLGKVDHCQVAVFAVLSDGQRHAPVDMPARAGVFATEGRS
ncbi:MAG TPA: hypothetical protein VK741_26220, partial [Acetobacteraceae bacterium]|nr:hypothetical protein [Acetobacteraceae bacterium]